MQQPPEKHTPKRIAAHAIAPPPPAPTLHRRSSGIGLVLVATLCTTVALITTFTLLFISVSGIDLISPTFAMTGLVIGIFSLSDRARGWEMARANLTLNCAFWIYWVLVCLANR